MAILQNITVSGSLVVTGNLTARQFILSSSVSYFTESFASGSTRFGDSLDDTMKVTGSLLLTGSVGINTIPQSWFRTAGTLQIGNSSLNQDSTYGTLILGSNAYMYAAGGAYKYLSNNYAAKYEMQANNGLHAWFVSPSGVAGADVNFTQSMTLTNAGNLGIGTATTNVGGFGSTVVTIAGPASTYSTIELGKVTASTNANLGVVSFFNGTNGDVANIIGVSEAANNTGALRFLTSSGTGGTERMRITSAGNVGIGTGNPSTNLDIRGTTPTGIKFTDDPTYTSYVRSYYVQFTNTYDITTERTDGGSYAGILILSSVLVASGANFNMYTFALGGRGTAVTATQLHNNSGGTASRTAVSLSFPSNGVIRLTLTGAETCNVKMTFIALNGV